MQVTTRQAPHMTFERKSNAGDQKAQGPPCNGPLLFPLAVQIRIVYS